MSLLDQFLSIIRDWRTAGPPPGGVPLEDIWLILPMERNFQVLVCGERSAISAVLLWCHGNAGQMATHRLENLRALYRLGLSVFLFDYRGYGKPGRPSEEGSLSGCTRGL